jgi:hypothetical protein
MANTSSFGFTNTTAATYTITPTEIGEKTNYAELQDDPTVHVRSNVTCPLDQGELLTLRCNPLDKITTTQTLVNPLKVKNGVQYVVKLEEILRTVNSDGDIVCDEPIVAYLTIRHQKTGNITQNIIDSVVKRLIGACYKSDGTPRWNDLMRSALEPTAD